MYSAYWIAAGLIAIAVAWMVWGKKYFSGYLTPEQIALIDFACEKAVEYAEQTYKETKGQVDRSQLAIDYAMEIVQKAGIVPDFILEIVKGMIKAYVLNLPPTHDQEGNIIV